jgi:hypothetical protein
MRPTRLSLTLAFLAVTGLAALGAARSGKAAEVTPSPIVKAPNYAIEAASEGACKAGAACTVKLVLKAQNGYHVNKEYPYKLKLQDTAGVEFDGKDAGGKNVFSKAAGDLTLDTETQATLRVRLKAAKSGAFTLTGTFKLSVCSDKNCLLETADVSIPVAVQ